MPSPAFRSTGAPLGRLSGESSPPRARYWLLPHVHACLSGRHVILLDLKQDRYLAIDAMASAPLAGVIVGWPVPEDATRPRGGIPAPSAINAACAMHEDGLLTLDDALGKPAAPITLRVNASLLSIPNTRSPGVTVRHVTAMVAAALQSAAELRLLSIHRITKRLARRRAACAVHSADSGAAQELHDLVALFFRLQPYFFQRSGQCLFNSLALARFLLHFGFASHWVFGVQDAPFTSHCWLVHGSTVLNDTLEHVRAYTPIVEV